MNRVTEISFSPSLLRKIRAVSFVTRLIKPGSVTGDGRRQMLIHGTRADDEMARLGVARKLNADWDFLRRWRGIGRAHADGWPARDFERLRQESTIEIAHDFL